MYIFCFIRSLLHTGGAMPPARLLVCCQPMPKLLINIKRAKKFLQNIRNRAKYRPKWPHKAHPEDISAALRSVFCSNLSKNGAACAKWFTRLPGIPSCLYNKEAETRKQRSTLPLQPSAKKFLPHPPSTCFMEREETYCAATANAARFISQPNALHRHTQRAASDREICCSWERDLLQLGKRFFAVGKEICCNWERDLLQLKMECG